MDKDVENQRASHPRIAQDNGKNHSRQRANCTTAAANSVSGSLFSNLPTSGKHNNGFDLTILTAPHPDRNPPEELEYFTLDLSRLFFVPEGWDKQQVPHTNVSWLISFSFVHLMWMMMTMMMVVVVVVMPVPKPLVWRQ